MDHWNPRHPLPTETDVIAATYGNGTFVAVGYNGTLFASNDAGATWMKAPGNGFEGRYEGVTFGNGMFVAVGEQGVIQTSTDGLSWTRQLSGTPQNLNEAGFGNNLFIVVGNEGTILTSADGVNWISRVSGLSGSFAELKSVAFGNGKFIVASQYDVLTSSNGVTWTKINYIGMPVFGITYGNGMFVAVGYDQIGTSVDGIVWNTQSFPIIPPDLPFAAPFQGVAYGNGTFVVVGGYGAIATSADGVTWTAQTSGLDTYFRGIGFGGGTFLAVGDGGALLMSADGISWANRGGDTRLFFRDIAFGGNRFVAVDGGGTLFSSEDGRTWSRQKPYTNKKWTSVSYGNGTFLAVGDSNERTVSSDGLNWTLIPYILGKSDHLYGSDYVNGKFMAVGDEGTIATATNPADPRDWNYIKLRRAPSNDPFVLYRASYGNGTTVVVSNGKIYYGNNEPVFSVYSPGIVNMYDVVYYKDKFVAVGANGTIATSTDGSSWIRRDSGTTKTLWGVGYGSNLFVAVGDGGTVLTSKDGIIWTSRKTNTGQSLTGVVNGFNTFMAVGGKGVLLQSDIIRYPVYYNPGAHGTVSSTVEKVVYGESPAGVPTVTENEGYAFDGWTVDGGVTKLTSSEVAATIITDDITYTSTYYLKSYPITYSEGLHGTLSTNSVSASVYQIGGTVTDVVYHFQNSVNAPIVTPNEGYTFAGWTSDGGATMKSSEEIAAVMVRGPVAYTAIYSHNRYPVTYQAGLNGTISVNGAVYQPGGSVTESVYHFQYPVSVPTVIPDEGYTFDGWSSDGGATKLTGTEVAATMVKGPVTYTAFYSYNRYPVTYRTGLHGTLSVNGAVYQTGGSVTESVYHFQYPVSVPTVTPDEGYTFAGWSSDDGVTKLTSTEVAATMVKGPVIYTAFYSPNRYQVTYKPGLHGTIAGSVSESVYMSGTSVIESVYYLQSPANVPTVTPNAGYTFIGWSSDEGATQLTSAQLAATKVTGAITYTAHYAVSSGNGNGGGGTDPASGGLALSALSISGVTLSPAFDPGTTAYTASAGNSVSSVTVTATVYNSVYASVTSSVYNAVYASVTASVYNPAGVLMLGPVTLTSGQASEPLPLDVGSNRIEVTAALPDGRKRTYAVTITRLSEDGSGNGGNNGNGGNGRPTGSGFSQSSGSGTAAGRTSADSGGGVKVVIDSSFIQRKTGPDGKVYELLVLSEQALKQALDMLKTADKPVIIIELNDKEPSVQVQFPSSLLLAAMAAAPDAVFEIRLNGSSFQLKAGALDLKGLAAQLGVKLEDLTVNVMIERVDGQAKEGMERSFLSQGLTQIGNAVDFKVTVEAGGRTAEVTDFGGAYLIRSIVLEGNAQGTGLTGVLYDPVTGTLTFMPSVLTTAPNGKPEVAINSPHNSIYTVMASKPRAFADMGGHWAKADVELLASKLVVQGATDSMFIPDNSVTRAEFAALLVRALGLSTGGKPAGSRFADVAPDAWYRSAVEAAEKAGLINGITRNHFAPDERITREQMALMFSRALVTAGKVADGAKARSQLTRFGDRTTISPWAEDAVASALASGIMNGMDEGRIAPSDYATRAQAAVMLKRFLQFVKFMD
ncbi:InlB B-repeat-containing protein [Paenibacillus mesophilus]|uniref:InlB B-repeat-containing protein n=1 Tax=Paenibacillus mesophilus TaxID=2582849 RepID=UPI0013052A51|nr:S-layer homology domain-containing protein [Paenibacillus mesophilus]